MLFIFDLDGTLADTSPGIIHCYNHAAALFDRRQRPEDQFCGIIGGPLLANFQQYYHMDQQTAREAVAVYRQRYGEKGIYEAELYKGIPKLLGDLRQRGHKTAIATLKREDFAITMMDFFHLRRSFDVIYGIDAQDTLSKADLLNKCIKATGAARQDSVLIGDSVHDARGAEQAGIRFIGVCYGWGFDTLAEIEAGYHHGAADSVSHLKTTIDQMIAKEEIE